MLSRKRPSEIKPDTSALMLSRRGVLAAAAVAGLTACTSGTGGGRTNDEISLSALEQTTVIPDGTPSEVSLAVSQALVASAPAVVLAAEADAADAWAAAISRGVPLLLLPSTGGDTPTADGATPSPDAPSPDASSAGTGTPNAGAGATSTGAADGVRAEIDRLKARTVLAVGKAAQAAAEELGVTVAADAKDLPKLTAKPAKGSVVLITQALPADDATGQTPEASADDQGEDEKGDDKPANPLETSVVAAAATARALGYPVITTPGGDPRDGSAAVEAIAKAKPERALAVGSAFGEPKTVDERIATAATGVQLPGGGQKIADKVYVALYGHPGTASLGVLGEQGVDKAVERCEEFAAPYRELTPFPVVPTFEIITTVATGGAGPDNDYSNEVAPDFILPWVDRAGQEGIYAMLDLQPGLDDLLDQAKRYEQLLLKPHVGLALDPEWKLQPGQRPLRQIGQVSSEEINRVGDWLAELVRKNKLPQKAFILHQFQLRMITDRDKLTFHDELQTIIHVDGHGTPGAKNDTYGTLTAGAQPQILWGWKNFIDEDSPMFSPAQTMKVTPTPTMVSYQ